MNQPNNKLEKINPDKSVQLNMFELLDPSHKDYSNSIELYDTMPKYHIGGVEREKGKKVESLPILTREFIHRSKHYKIDIAPAPIVDKKSGKTIYYYASQREELVEDALRKIATTGRVREFVDKNEIKVGVIFSYYEVQQELEKMGHGYSIAEIKIAIEILSKAVIEVTSKDDEISITNNFFTSVGKETKEMGGKERVVVIFHSLVSKSINSGNYRLFNYDKHMRLKMQLSRWLHKRISHMFLQATITNPYEIKLSTIVRDSGMKEYKTISERARQVEKSLNELMKPEVNIISKWKKAIENEKNKILDVKYSLYMSESFVSDTKKANRLTNDRLDNEIEVASYNIDELRIEIEKPIYGLTKTIINSTLNKIKNKNDFDNVVSALEAVKEYIEIKKQKKEEVINIAITKIALRENWKPKNKFKQKDLFEDKGEKILIKSPAEKLEEYQKLKNDPIIINIFSHLERKFAGDEWNKWLINLDIDAFDNDKIIFCVNQKFYRDWIIQYFVNNNKLLDAICEISPEIKSLKIIYKEKE